MPCYSIFNQDAVNITVNNGTKYDKNQLNKNRPIPKKIENHFFLWHVSTPKITYNGQKPTRLVNTKTEASANNI